MKTEPTSLRAPRLLLCLALMAGMLAATHLWAQDNGAPTLSAPAAQVLSMAEASASQDALLQYVQSSPSPFNLRSDDVTYLRDMGVTSAVIDAMLDRDKALLQQPANYNQQLYAPSAPPPPAAPAVEAPVENVTDAPEDVTYFYSDLAPYGSWVNLEGYGWCWQPTTVAVDAGWRPYGNAGHWVYTDQGWFWDSDYSWGWAPFHYGRWFHHDRVGWVWFPDRVWGPAWVTWRVEDNHCGWAPLPVNVVYQGGGLFYHGVSVGVDFNFGLSADLFTFVGIGDFCDRDVFRHQVPRDQIAGIYGRTHVINDYRPDHGVIVNRGLTPDRIVTVTHRPITPVPIHDTATGPARHDERGGVTLGVYRREVHAPARPVTVQVQHVDDRHPVVQHVAAPLVPGNNRSDRGPGRDQVTPVGRGMAPSGGGPVTKPQDTRRPAAPDVKASTSPVNTDPTVKHGRSVVANPAKVDRSVPDTYEVKPEEQWKAPASAPAPKPQGPFDYQQRIQRATDAHVLPPAPPVPHEASTETPAPNNVTHTYTPRIQQATTAHELPAQKGYVPPTTIFRSPPPSTGPSVAPSLPSGRTPAPSPAPAPAPTSGGSSGGSSSGGGSRDNGGGRGRGN